VIGLILFGQNYLYVKLLFYKGFRYSEVFQKILQSEKSVPCQPSRRCVIMSGRSSVHCSIRLDDVPYRPDAQTDLASFVRTTLISVRTLHCIEKLLFQLASVQTSKQPVWTPLSIRPSFRFFPSSVMGRLMQLSGRRGFPSGRTSP
jgi:hypothetical protein